VFADDSKVNGLLDAADSYVGNVRTSKLAMVTDQVRFVIDTNATIRPVYDVAVAEYRSVEGSDAKYPMSTFTNKLTERGKVLRNQADYVWPIASKTMNTIVFWEGDAEYHESVLESFVTWAGKQGREISFGGYVSFLKGWRDAEGSWYTEDGDYTERGKTELAKQAKVDEAMVDAQWCAMDFKTNLSGMAAAAQLAWIDAALHDLNVLRAKIAKPMDAKTKKQAKDLLDGNTGVGQKIGGDRITDAIVKATAAAS